ncbi:MAG: type II secretion system F family protein [Candidatus Micrarchaeia archaeon]|jgi:flagellar protein FlaJ
MADPKDDKARSRKEIMERMIREAQKAQGGKPADKPKTPSVLTAPPPLPPAPKVLPPVPKAPAPKPAAIIPPAPKAVLPPAPKFSQPAPAPSESDAFSLPLPLSPKKPMPPAPSAKAKSGGFSLKIPSLPSMPSLPKQKQKEAPRPPLPSALRALPFPPAAPSSTIVSPVMTSRKPPSAPAPRQRREGPLHAVAKRISAGLPDLRRRLREAGMPDDPVGFVQKALIGTIVMAFLFGVLLFFIFDMFDVSKSLLILLLPLLFGAAFFYQLQYPTAKAKKRARLVDRELVFAGRQMLIELKAGVPLFDAMLSISRDYGEVSKEFAKIAERVNAGVPTDIAMHDISEDNPSMAFKRVLLQLINSIRSGSDVAKALESVLDQISREQITEMKAYGQKLNPIGMFYMIFGIIMPSLGIALGIIIFSFMSVSVTNAMLYSVLFVVLIMQYIFLTIIESQKPDYEL